MSSANGLISSIYLWYSSTLGSLPNTDAIAESSADAKNTSAPSPNLFGKFLVDVDTTVELARTLAWLPIHKEHPGSSVLAPDTPNTL